MKNLTQTASNASMAVRMSFYKVKTVRNIDNEANTSRGKACNMDHVRINTITEVVSDDEL